MTLRYAAALAAAMVIAPAPAQAQNYPNSSCYLSDGSQYYMRAFRGGRMIEERGICDEGIGTYDIPMNVNGHQFYLSQRDWDWLIGMAGTEVLLVRVNKQTGQRSNLGRL